jgi:hypothetical protein
VVDFSAGNLNAFSSAFNPSSSVSSFLPGAGSPFGSFGDYSSFGSGGSSGGGNMFFAGLGSTLVSGGLGLAQGFIGQQGAQNASNAARTAAKQARKNIEKQYELAFDSQIGADAFNFGLQDLGAQRSLMMRNSEPYLRAEGRRVGSEIAGRFMDPAYAARTAQMFYG